MTETGTSINIAVFQSCAPQQTNSIAINNRSSTCCPYETVTTYARPLSIFDTVTDTIHIRGPPICYIRPPYRAGLFRVRVLVVGIRSAVGGCRCGVCLGGANGPPGSRPARARVVARRCSLGLRRSWSGCGGGARRWRSWSGRGRGCGRVGPWSVVGSWSGRGRVVVGLVVRWSWSGCGGGAARGPSGAPLLPRPVLLLLCRALRAEIARGACFALPGEKSGKTIHARRTISARWRHDTTTHPHNAAQC